MNQDAIIITAIHYELERLTSSALQHVASALLDEGVSTPSWVELATLRNPIRSEMLDLLRTALQEIQVEMPPESEWWNIMTRHYIHEVAESGDNARKALQTLMDEVYWPHISGFKAEKYVGDSHDLQLLIGLYWGYDDLTQRPKEVSYAGKYGNAAIHDWNRDVVKEAKAWLARNQPQNFGTRILGRARLC